jgi:hypothetical protein
VHAIDKILIAESIVEEEWINGLLVGYLTFIVQNNLYGLALNETMVKVFLEPFLQPLLEKYVKDMALIWKRK